MMNISFDHFSHRWLRCFSNTELLGDILDPASQWYDLRVADLSGFDYVFIPDFVGEKIGDLNALQALLYGIQTLLGSDLDRIIIISHSSDSDAQSFCRYLIQWQENEILGCIKKNLAHETQNEFIATLFQHSEKLIINQLTDSTLSRA